MAKRRVLGEEHRKRLDNLCKSCAETREYLQSCKECHLNVEQEIQQNDEQERIAQAILKRHFPKRP